MRLLHTSDCHLGTRGAEPAFALLAEYARASSDVLVVAGDLFDSPQISPGLVDWAGETLRAIDLPVVILPGNHDPATAGALWERLQAASGPRVHFLDGQCVTAGGVVFWGRAVRNHDPAFRPLRDVPPRPDGPGVLVAHGLVTDDLTTRRGSPILPEDLATLTWDYVALGHWPTRREVAGCPVPAHYSGALPCSQDGRAGALLVELDGGPPGVSWVAIGA